MTKLLVCTVVAASIAWSADNTLSAEEKRAGFRLLFDGRTFHGWRDPASMNPPGDAWVIEDGCLKTTASPKIREDLISAESYRDFELKFDWRISPKGNTGVKYRIQQPVFIETSRDRRTAQGFEATVEKAATDPTAVREKAGPGATGQGYTIAFEFQLIDDAGYEQALHKDQYTGALYSMIPPRVPAANAPGEWNEARLVVKGNRFEHWINGTKVLDGTLDSAEVQTAIGRRWEKAPTVQKLLRNARPSGPLSLQHHGAAVWFKNLKIRPL